MADPDDDLLEMDRDRLIEEAKRLRAGIREHRDSSLHALCWHHPRLWGLLPERIEPEIAVPDWPQFLRSEARRVGNDCVRTARIRWHTSHSKKKTEKESTSRRRQ